MAVFTSTGAQHRTPSGHLATPKMSLTGSVIEGFFSIWRERQHLSQLDPRMLRDVGLTEGDVTREVNRPLWDAPRTWQV